MNSDSIFSNEFNVSWDDGEKCLLIGKISKDGEIHNLIKIRDEILDDMSFEEASKFIGERLILLIPHLHSKFKNKFPFPEK